MRSPVYLEVRSQRGPQLVALDAERVTLGRAPSNDIALPGDGAVSRRHAIFEHYPAGWCVRDLGSSNGTYVNGRRIDGAWLEPDDEIVVGESHLVFRSQQSRETTDTVTAAGPPDLTPREREVLVALCRPLLQGSVFTEPAGIRQVAEELVISEAAVKSHLAHLYEKFGVEEEAGQPRRLRLANEAIRRRAVFLADLRDPTVS